MKTETSCCSTNPCCRIWPRVVIQVFGQLYQAHTLAEDPYGRVKGRCLAGSCACQLASLHLKTGQGIAFVWVAFKRDTFCEKKKKTVPLGSWDALLDALYYDGEAPRVDWRPRRRVGHRADARLKLPTCLDPSRKHTSRNSPTVES